MKLSFRKESEHCTADAELNDLRGSIGGAHQIGRIVACIDVPELVAMIIDLRVEEGRVFISSSGLIQESIHLLRKLRQGQVPMRRDHPQRSLHHRHDERSGDALARDVRHRDPDLFSSQIEKVVVVAPDRPRGKRKCRERSSRASRRLRWQQSPLHFGGQCKVPPHLLLFHRTIR